MNRNRFKSRVAALLLLAACFLIQPLPVHGNSETADEATPTSAATPVSAAATLTLIGQVVNTQGADVDEAQVRVFVGGDPQTLTMNGKETEVAHTHPDGSLGFRSKSAEHVKEEQRSKGREGERNGLNEFLEDAMSRQAQAERERQARVILGESEEQIAGSFAKASEAYRDNPTALHLRAMNMLFEGLKERGAMVIVPSSAVDTMNLGGVMGLSSMAGMSQQMISAKDSDQA
ncbi:MAG: hypothetical protein V3S14_16650 [Anaerolineae bacterium]